MNKTKNQLDSYLTLINNHLSQVIPICPSPEDRVAAAMGYSLLSGGKRIRAVLLLAFYSLFSPDVEKALPFAAAIEMIHAYSLIHDDLPCMDDDDLRRGKPSCHIAFDEATALLAGDGLLTLAFETISNPNHAKDFSPDKLLAATHCLAAAAGVGGMIGGQMIDLYQQGKETDTDTIMRMYAKKTGALITAAGKLGCILAGAGEKDIVACQEYCDSVGLAFQIVDDILDCVGDENTIGKPIGSDQENNKATYLSIFGQQKARQMVLELNKKAKKSLGTINADIEFLSGVADILSDRNY